jgi:hypothetical protein
VSATVPIEKVMADADRTEGEASTVVRTKGDSAAPPRAVAGVRGKTWLVSCLLFAGLVGVYQANGDFTISHDATGNTYLPVRLLTRGCCWFTPTEMPFMFAWALQTPEGPERVRVSRWDETQDGRTFAELRRLGKLRFLGPDYYLIPSVRDDRATGDRIYVNTFGVGAGLTALPLFAVIYVAIGDLSADPRVLWYGAKLVASLLVAGSALFIFHTALLYTTRGRALLLAVAYGVGTCVWSISSQALWQHGPNEFFLAMGTFFLTRIGRGKAQAAACGLAYAAAVVCRPTSAIVVVAVGLYLLVTQPKALLVYALAGLPVAGALGWYNAYYHGSPISFGRGPLDQRVALVKTGSDQLWQTPLWEGAAGLLLSPSRGLLTHSPFIGFAIAGLVVVWRNPVYGALRPLTLALIGLLLIAFKWFDWWGGYCFGYRPIVDTIPLFAVLLIPVIDVIVARKSILVAFLLLLAWSVLVQVVGAFAYDPLAWNQKVYGYLVYLPNQNEPVVAADKAEVARIEITRPARAIQEVNGSVDKREYRYRLWLVSDNQIFYFLRNFAASRQTKRKNMEDWLNPSSDRGT